MQNLETAIIMTLAGERDRGLGADDSGMTPDVPWDYIAQTDPYEMYVEQCNDDEMSDDVTFLDGADFLDGILEDNLYQQATILFKMNECARHPPPKSSMPLRSSSSIKDIAAAIASSINASIAKPPPPKAMIPDDVVDNAGDGDDD